MILETKGYDPLEEVKRAAAQRWVAAVNADGTYGRWLRKKAPGAVDRLDGVVIKEAEVVAGSPTKVGAAGASAGPEATDSQILGGEGGIRTPGTGISPYNRLAICPVQPLQHLSTTTYGHLPGL